MIYPSNITYLSNNCNVNLKIWWKKYKDPIEVASFLLINIMQICVKLFWNSGKCLLLKNRIIFHSHFYFFKRKYKKNKQCQKFLNCLGDYSLKSVTIFMGHKRQCFTQSRKELINNWPLSSVISSRTLHLHVNAPGHF